MVNSVHLRPDCSDIFIIKSCRSPIQNLPTFTDAPRAMPRGITKPMSYQSSHQTSHQTSQTPLQQEPQRRLGSYLLEAGLISKAQIEVVLNDQQNLCEMRFGEVLVARGWIKPETIDFVMRHVVEPERAYQIAQTAPISQPVPPPPPPPPLPPSAPKTQVMVRARSVDGDFEFDIVNELSQDLMPTVPFHRSTDSGLRRNDRKSLPSIPDEDGVNWAG
jgi:hypothetical protein